MKFWKTFAVVALVGVLAIIGYAVIAIQELNTQIDNLRSGIQYELSDIETDLSGIESELSDIDSKLYSIYREL